MAKTKKKKRKNTSISNLYYLIVATTYVVMPHSMINVIYSLRWFSCVLLERNLKMRKIVCAKSV